MFEWNAEKSTSNLGKHGVSFEEAQTAFLDPLAVCFPDEAHSVIEQRYILVGYSIEQRLLFVSHQERGDHIRLISARLATLKERKRHEQHT